MNRPTTDWDKLGRYVAGELSPADAAEVKRWLDANPAEAKAVAALTSAASGVTARPVDVEAALRKVKTRLNRGTPAMPWVRLAMAAGVVLAVGLVWRLSPRTGSEPGVRTYATAVGQRDSIALGDGSRVLLGPASRLIVRDREAELTGEAFFVVTHDARRPFTVRAGGAVVRDIGTEFSVHSDDADEVRVVVREGSVQLSRSGDSVVLARGDVGVRAAGGRVQATRGAATEDDMAWTFGRLVFRNASVAELGADLKRWYGVELRVTDSALLRRHFTGSFAGEPVGRVMDVIALALGARADRRGDTVYIRPGTSTPR